MFENDVIHAFQGTRPAAAKSKFVNDATKQVNDGLIQETNSSSIVSKRSVEKLFYHGEPEYFRYFVSKFKRRSPLINRGYWLRMRAIDHTVEQFLREPTSKQKVVINLGCGYDPLPWLFLGKQPQLCSNARFIDVDYPALMRKKIETIRTTRQLTEPLHDLEFTSSNDGILCTSKPYVAIGCDLINLDFLRFVLKEQMNLEACSVAILFVAEVSIAYMDYDGSQAVIEWASAYEDVRFCLLEQHLPDGKDHPFAQTMLKHFDKLRTPLRAIGTMSDMCQRFVSAGWPSDGLNMQSLWRLWSDPTFLTNQQRQALDKVEPFDEWEEFALFASHYYLLVARKGEAVRSAATTPAIPLPQSVPSGSDIIFEELDPRLSTQRRFAALVPETLSSGKTFGVHGGLSTRERLNDMAVLTSGASTASLKTPPMREGLMCHTITEIEGNDCLLVGGRASPDKPLKDCWLRKDGIWSRTQDLPEPRYRHCAAAFQAGVLVFGGKTSSGALCNDVLHWTEVNGWRQVTVAGELPSGRFGSAMCKVERRHLPHLFESIPNTQDAWVLTGGMNEFGLIQTDVLVFYEDGGRIVFKNVTDLFMPSLGAAIPRMGAKLVLWTHPNSQKSLLLVGGVRYQDLLTRDDEIVNLTLRCAHRLEGSHPLFTGFDVHQKLVVSGGATCFSFGTNWNDVFKLRFADEVDSGHVWHLQKPETRTATSSVPVKQDFKNPTHPISKSTVLKTTVQGSQRFEVLLKAGVPVIITGADLGPCTTKWTPDELKTLLGERKVIIHSSDDNRLDFKAKNFQYETQTFSDFISSAQSGRSLYLRALSSEAPSEKPTALAVDWPEIAHDFNLPPAFDYVAKNAHSSPLRIAAGNTAMWLHYDVMANVLCQVHGSKKLILYPPSDIEHLGIDPGASSSSFDAFNVNYETHPQMRHCHRHEASLEPGDILFIPPLWCHAAAPTGDISIAVNIFFRDLQEGYAAGKDVYGNRDLAAYERGRKDVAKIAKSFDALPAATREFYLKRLALELRSLIDG